jgi:hypothetical protein
VGARERLLKRQNESASAILHKLNEANAMLDRAIAADPILKQIVDEI